MRQVTSRSVYPRRAEAKLFSDPQHSPRSASDWKSPDFNQVIRHCCKVSDEVAFCLIEGPYISKTLLTRRISPRGSP